MPSQVPEDIFSNGYTPEPIEPHAIEREAEAAQGPEAVEWTERESAGPVEPVEPEAPLSAQSPEPVEWVQNEPVAPVEPVEWVGRDGTQSPEPVEWDASREPAQPPQPVEYETDRTAVNVPESVEWPTDRNTAEPVQPTEWIERQGMLPPLPEITIDVPPEHVDRSRIRFRNGPMIRETFWEAE